MATVDYKETELWLRAKSLLTESYRLTKGWPVDGKDLARDIRVSVREIVRSVPNAYKRSGIAGNVGLRISSSQFGVLEAMCEAAEVLEFVDAGHFQGLLGLCVPIQAEFKALEKASREQALELVRKRTQLIGGQFDGDEE